MRAALSELQSIMIGHPLAAVSLFVLLRSASVIYPPVPGFPIDIAGITLFGVVRGFVYAESGIMLGAIIAFAVARLGKHKLPERSVASLRRLESHLRGRNWLPNGEYWWHQAGRWALLRLFTNPLFDPICYVAGLTETPFGAYVLGSFVGNVPSMMAFYLIEGNVHGTGVPEMWITAVAFLALALHVGSRCLG